MRQSLRLVPVRQSGAVLHLGLAAAAAISACKSKGGGPTEPGPTPAIALAVSPGSATVTQGGSTPVSATLTRSGGFTGDVNLTVDGAPAGVSGAVSNMTTSGGVTSATVIIAVGASTAPGSYNLTLRGTGTGVAASAPFSLTVTETPEFSLSAAPGSASVTQGQSSGAIAITINRTNFPDAVTLSLVGPVPAGVTAAFTPPAPTTGGSSLVISVGAAVTPGVYNLTVSGTGTPGTRSTPFVLSVTAAPSFSLDLSPAGGVTIVQGVADNSKTVNISRTNYPSDITLTAENLPAGMTAVFAPNPTGGNSSVLTLAASGAVAPNVYSITIRGAGPASLLAGGPGASLEATATLAVTVTAPAGSFTLGVDFSCPAGFVLPQGALDDARMILINRTNFPSGVALTVDGLPAGMTASFAPSPATGTSSRLTLTASETVVPGTYNLTVRGTGPASLRAPGAPSAPPAIQATVAVPVQVVTGAAPTPDVLDYDFSTGYQGWLGGSTCFNSNQPDWGVVIAQEQMMLMDGIGPAANAGIPNAWIEKLIAIPAGATTFRFDASGHFVNGANTRAKVRILDNGTSTIVFDQVITGSAPVRVFTTKTADITAFAGKTVRIFIEQDDNGFSGSFPGAHEQLWVDNIHIGSGGGGPAPVLDASCPGPRTSQSGGGTTKRRAQVFTALHTGALTRAKMEISGNPTGGDFLLAIRAVDGTGKPLPPVLASATVFNVTPTNLAQNFTLDATFTAPAQVTAGTSYALSVEPTAGQDYFANGQAFGSCTAAKRWSDPAMNEGWVFDSVDPLLFTVYVTPPAP